MRPTFAACITALDDVLDLTEAVSERVVLFEIHEVEADAKQLSQVLVKSCEAVARAIRLLPTLKRSREILDLCVEINRLENEADRTYRHALATLYRANGSPQQALSMCSSGATSTTTSKLRPTAVKTWRTSSKGSCWSTPDERRADRHDRSGACFRLHQRLSRRGELDRHGRVDTRALTAHGRASGRRPSTSSRFKVFETESGGSIAKGVDPHVGLAHASWAPRWSARSRGTSSPGGWRLPTSSSHALLGGLRGRGDYEGRLRIARRGLLLKTAAFIVVSPMFGMVLGALLMRLTDRALRTPFPERRRSHLSAASARLCGALFAGARR